MRPMHAVLVLTLLAPFSTAQDKKPQKAPLPAEIAKGNDLIHQGKIAEALDLFKKYEATNPGNKYSAKAIRPLTQALQLEKIVAKGNHPRFVKAADWLQKFYTVNKVPSGLLPLARQAYKQMPSDTNWGVRYATALANNSQEDKALEVYGSLLAKKNNPALHAKAAVLLARKSKTDAARKHIQAIPADSTCPTTTLDRARAHACLGELEEAGAALKRSFELTPPSQLEARKKLTLDDSDLAVLRGTGFLKQAYAAKSCVSDPAGGACGSCSQKGSCGKEQKEGGCGDSKEGGCGEKGGCETPPVKK